MFSYGKRTFAGGGRLEIRGGVPARPSFHGGLLSHVFLVFRGFFALFPPGHFGGPLWSHFSLSGPLWSHFSSSGPLWSQFFSLGQVLAYIRGPQKTKPRHSFIRGLASAPLWSHSFSWGSLWLRFSLWGLVDRTCFRGGRGPLHEIQTSVQWAPQILIAIAFVWGGLLYGSISLLIPFFGRPPS